MTDAREKRITMLARVLAAGRDDNREERIHDTLHLEHAWARSDLLQQVEGACKKAGDDGDADSVLVLHRLLSTLRDGEPFKTGGLR